MLQIRSHLDVADNTGAKIAWHRRAGPQPALRRSGDIIKVHIKDAAPDGQVKKGEVHNAVVVRTASPSAATTVRICALTATRWSSLTRN